MTDGPLATRQKLTLRLRLTGAAFFALFLVVGIGLGIAVLVKYFALPPADRKPASLIIGILPVVFIAAGALGMRAALKGQLTGGAVTKAPGFIPAVARQEAVLKPSTSRQTVVVFLALFTILWNGMVIFVLNSVMGAGAAVSIGVAAFLLPFIAIGLLLTALTLHQLLGLANPKAKIVVSSPAVALGDELTINWSIDGAIERLRHFSIDLEGREEATYPRDDSTRTDRRVFATIPIIASEGTALQRSGFTTIRIPPNAMHSFNGPNNKVVWALRVRGQIPRWPNSNDEYRVTISPRQP